MSALPVEPPENDPRSDRDILIAMDRRLAKAEAFIDELMPTLRLMSDELRRGGLMGLMGAMMRSPKG